MPKSKVGKAIMFLLTLPLLVAGCVMLVEQITFATHSVTTTATVTGYRANLECRKSGCTTYYAAKVTFTTAEGQEIATTLTNARSRTRPVEGQAISIEYRSDEPTIAQRPEDAGFNWRIPSLMVGFGVLVTGYCIYSFFERPPHPTSTRPPPVMQYYCGPRPPGGRGQSYSPGTPYEQAPHPQSQYPQAQYPQSRYWPIHQGQPHRGQPHRTPPHAWPARQPPPS